jgi:hypothetical protein
VKKIETIWHHLLYDAIEQKQFQHTQAGLAQTYRMSTSTVNLALIKPTAIGAIRKSGKFFVVADVLKLLYLWATVRNLPHDVLYQTYSDLSINQLVGIAPPNALFGGYYAASQILGEPPADYTTLHLYLPKGDLELVKTRYPFSKTGLNQVIVYHNPLDLYSQIKTPTATTSLPNTFVDIWNLSDWYARDFTQGLEDKIHGLLS